jgi:tetratricopeptide (TPR) repeat protein
MVIRFYTYLLCALLLLSGCKTTKDTVSSRKGESGEVEPEQLKPTVDTRFQEVFFQAQLEKAKDNKAKAHELFVQCVALEPKNAAVHFEVGKYELQERNNASEALVHAKMCVESDAQNPWYLLLLAQSYASLSKYDAAIKAYREVVRLSPDNYEIIYELAEVQLYANKPQDAITTYDLLESKTGVYEDLSIQKHLLYEQLKNYDKAGLELERLAEFYPEEPRYWGMAAQFYQRYNLKDKAAVALQKMVIADPNNGQVHWQLSEYYATQGDEKRSYEELKLAFGTTDVPIDQKVLVLMRYYTLTQQRPDRLPDAYALLELTEQVHANEAKGYAMYGDFLARDGKLKEALQKYKRAVELGASMSLIWKQVLELEAELSDYEALSIDAPKALELYPLVPEFYYFNGLAQQHKKNPTKAIDAFLLGKELVVDNPVLLKRFYAALAESYNTLKQYDKSDAAFEEALRIDPADVFVMNNYAYYLALRKVKLDSAANLSARSNELQPGMASFEDTYAFVLFRQGKHEEAFLWMKKATAHGEVSADMHEHLGDILFHLGKTDEAVNEWKQAAAKPGASGKVSDKMNQRRYID